MVFLLLSKGVATMCKHLKRVREETKHEQSIEIAKSFSRSWKNDL